MMEKEEAAQEDDKDIIEQVMTNVVEPSSEEENGMVAVEVEAPPSAEDVVIQSKTTTTISTEIEFDDHFSLHQPSSQVTFRRGTTTSLRVYDLHHDQVQLLVDSQKIIVKRRSSGSWGLCILRGVYTLVALFMLGLLLVFSATVLMSQILEIPQSAGTGGTAASEVRIHVLIATILSLPLWLYSLGSLLTMASAFCSDTWNGHNLFASMMTLPEGSTVMEWVCFLFYVVVPAVTAIVAMFAGVQDFWQVTVLVWCISMLISFVIFAGLITYHEVLLCWQLTGQGSLMDTVLTTTTQRLAGLRDQQYRILDGQQHDNNAILGASSSAPPEQQSPVSKYTGPYSRMTQLLSYCGCYQRLDPPQRRYTAEEIRDVIPVLSKKNWSLEKLFCQNQSARSLSVLSGEDGLEGSQFLSVMICAILGVILMVLLFASAMVWVTDSLIAIAVSAGIAVVCCCPMCWSSVRLLKSMPRAAFHNNKKTDDDNDETLYYQVWHTYAVTTPQPWYCWFRMVVDIVIFFLWPLVTLYVEGLPKVATLYLVFGMVSLVRIYMDPSMVFAKLGSINSVSLYDNDEKQDKAAQARASEILGKVTCTKGRYLWMVVLAGISGYILYTSLQSQDADDAIPPGGRPPIRLLPDFEYPPQPDLSYPACKLNKGFEVPGSDYTYMVDFIMLAALAYETPNVTDYLLDKWFDAEDPVIDETPLVNQWREDTGNVNHPVSFKLFSIPSLPGRGIVSVRGTETNADRILNAQLYFTSMLTAAIRAFMPFNFLFTNVWDDLLGAVSWITSEQLQKSAYYQVTTQFATDLMHNNYTYNGKSFDWIRFTGVSLGGGIAMISGAQTEGSATVAVSGVNPVLARLTFDPPITQTQLDTKLLNIHPERDYISAIGDTPRNTQVIECRTPISSVGTCHSFWRVFCEFLYSCGSQPRSVLCVCNEQYGYPEPQPREGTERTFAEACAQEEAIVSQLG